MDTFFTEWYGHTPNLSFLQKRKIPYFDFGISQEQTQEQTEPSELLQKSRIFTKKAFFSSKAHSKKQVQLIKGPVKVPVRKALREPSILIKGEWLLQAEFSKLNLQKAVIKPGQAQTIAKYSSLLQYNSKFDRKTLKNHPRVNSTILTYKNSKIAPEFSFPTTSEDPIMAGLFQDPNLQVFITDKILSTIMTITRSVYPWHIFLSKKEGKIIFDKDQDSNVDTIHVNQNSQQNLLHQEEQNLINTPKSLSEQALRINKIFYLNFVNAPISPQGEPHPLQKSNSAFKSYWYQKFQVGEYNIVVRTEKHAQMVENDSENQVQKKFVHLHALHEYDTSLTGGYRVKIEREKGQILAAELKNNACRLAKVAIEAILSRSDYLKLAFYSREHFKKTDFHNLFYVDSFRTNEFPNELNLNVHNCWGIFKTVLDTLKLKDDGNYILVKDPVRPVVKLYNQVSAFSAEEAKFDN